MSERLTHEDCLRLYESGLMSDEDFKDCSVSYHDFGMQSLRVIDQDHMGLDTYNESYSKAKTIATMTGRDPEIMDVAGRGIPQESSNITLLGRDPRNDSGGEDRSPLFYLGGYALLVLGLAGAYAVANDLSRKKREAY